MNTQPTQKNKCAAKVDNTKCDYIFHESASHGWLEVPLYELDKLGIRNNITSFSYHLNGRAYLEEDVDMTTFINAKEYCGDWNSIWYENVTNVYDANWEPNGERFPAISEERLQSVMRRNSEAFNAKSRN